MTPPFRLAALGLFGLSAATHAAEPLPTLPRYEHAQIDITLDGYLDEPVWQSLPVIDGMRVIQPDTLEPAPVETHSRIFYT